VLNDYDTNLGSWAVQQKSVFHCNFQWKLPDKPSQIKKEGQHHLSTPHNVQEEWPAQAAV